MNLRPLSVAVLAAVLWSAAAQAAPDPVTGFWYTQDKEGVVELYGCGAQICGRLHWFENEDRANPSRDSENPDPAKRNRPLCGMEFMTGFTYGANGRYNDGRIYSPRSGSIYTARMTLTDRDTLDLHGYVLHPFFGQSQIWKRAENPPACTTGNSMGEP